MTNLIPHREGQAVQMTPEGQMAGAGNIARQWADEILKQQTT